MTKLAGRTNIYFWLLAAAWMSLAGLTAMAQGSAKPDSDMKVRAFDVVSIKRNAGGTGSMIGVGSTYRALNEPVVATIMLAYFPTGVPWDHLKNAPSWVVNDKYDVVAKVDDATAEAWKSLPQGQLRENIKSMLATMLLERFKLAAHTIPAEMQGYALIVGKRGAKLKEAQLSEVLPEQGRKLPDGGMMVGYKRGDKPELTYFQTSMASLAANLTTSTHLPFVDQTGLTGKYDFVLPKVDTTSTEPGQQRVGSAPTPDDLAHYWDFDAIGLELKPIKMPTTNLVIDSIERPSEN